MNFESLLENPVFHLLVILTVCGCGFGCGSTGPRLGGTGSTMVLTKSTLPREGLKDAVADESAAASRAASGAAIRTVTFPYDSYELTQDAREVLKINAEIIRSRRAGRVLVEGHCDEIGTTEYNLALGERRAFAVREYYELLDLDPSLFRTISYGKERPLCLDDNDACHLMNRRASTALE